MGHGGRTWTTSPWLWLDQEKCSDESPIQCYFPSIELQCPSDAIPQAGTTRGYINECNRILGNHTQEQWSMFRAATTEYMFRNVSHIVIEEAERQLKLVFPEGRVPPNLITVHIRWGDKILAEMTDKPNIQEYIDGVKSILAMRNQSSSEQVNIFLATEDPSAVREFKEAAPKEWNVHVDQYFHDMLPHREEKVHGMNNNMNANITKGRAGLVALGSLLVAVEANDFVLTTRSNWSRLMNELRKNVLDPRCGNCTRMIDLKKGEM
jgi:hypothetical protein